MRRVRTLIAALALGSCVEEQADGTVGTLVKPLPSAERAECLANGGTVGVRTLPEEVCFPKFNDVGKSCTKKADCEGMCKLEPVSRVASCAKVEPTRFSCFEFLDEDGQAVAVCVD